MKKITIILTLIAFIFINKSDAQCLQFAKTEGFAKLDTAIYIPEGRLSQLPLSQGDNIDVYKPFFRGRKYKVVVIGDNLPGMTFKVKNFQRQVLFDSSLKGNTETWEFVSDKNQNLIIHVEVPGVNEGTPITACMAVIVGFKE